MKKYTTKLEYAGQDFGSEFIDEQGGDEKQLLEDLKTKTVSRLVVFKMEESSLTPSSSPESWQDFFKWKDDYVDKNYSVTVSE